MFNLIIFPILICACPRPAAKTIPYFLIKQDYRSNRRRLEDYYICTVICLYSTEIESPGESSFFLLLFGFIIIIIKKKHKIIINYARIMITIYSNVLLIVVMQFGGWYVGCITFLSYRIRKNISYK